MHERCRRDEQEYGEMDGETHESRGEEGVTSRRTRKKESKRKIEGNMDIRRNRQKEGETEREELPENYKLYVVPNRPSKIIPAHPAAIMNM